MYGSGSKTLESEIRGLVRMNRRVGQQHRLRTAHTLAQALLEAEYRVASHMFGFFLNSDFHGHGSEVRILFNAFHSGLFHFWSALQLTRDGLIGSARPLLRLLFEGMVMAKACSHGANAALQKRWDSGDPYISINRDVLQQLERPEPIELRRLWAELCGPTHFSVYAGQPSLEIDFTREQAWSNYSLLLLLLVLNSHLLLQHLLTRKLRYYIVSVANETWRTDNLLLRKTTQAVRRFLPAPSKTVVREYCASWIFRRKKKPSSKVMS